MLAGVVSSDDEADGIEYRIFLLNRSEYKINDTWNATGLCGTGSNDVWVEDAFVAEKMTVAVSELTGGPTPGSAGQPERAVCAAGILSLSLRVVGCRLG
jgi:3-hydroxy-9,10-secoandrosta-1,3,5(10)-triene-9,17-dione monooxygenase